MSLVKDSLGRPLLIKILDPLNRYDATLGRGTNRENRIRELISKKLPGLTEKALMLVACCTKQSLYVVVMGCIFSGHCMYISVGVEKGFLTLRQ